jgi:hypothetical protein
MTVRTIGRQEKTARLSLGALAVSLALSVPAGAQQADTPAPTPAPSSTFRLPPANDGRAPGVQGPADNNIPPLSPGDSSPAPTPAPAPAAPPVVATQPSRTTPTPAPASAIPAPRRDAAAPVQAAPRPAEAAPDATAPADAAAPATDGAPAASPGFSSDPTAPVTPAPAADTGATPSTSGETTPIWAWLLAGLAAAGAGFWYWRRRPAVAGAAPAEYAEPVPAAKPLPRAAEPAPRPAPATPPRAPVAPVPAAPAAAAPSVSPLVTRPAAEQRAIVSMALDIRGIRMTREQLVVAFTLNLLNQGPVAATGLMVRIALNQGSAMTEPVLARFFDGAGGSVLRDDMVLEPGAGEQLSTEVMLPRAAVEPLIIGGKPMLVPVMAFDVTYHWDGEGDAFGQNAGTFVLGREQGTSGSEKLAPLPLDHPNFVVNRPAARTTAIRRAQ